MHAVLKLELEKNGDLVRVLSSKNAAGGIELASLLDELGGELNYSKANACKKKRN